MFVIQSYRTDVDIKLKKDRVKVRSQGCTLKGLTWFYERDLTLSSLLKKNKQKKIAPRASIPICLHGCIPCCLFPCYQILQMKSTLAAKSLASFLSGNLQILIKTRLKAEMKKRLMLYCWWLGCFVPEKYPHIPMWMGANKKKKCKYKTRATGLVPQISFSSSGFCHIECPWSHSDGISTSKSNMKHIQCNTWLAHALTASWIFDLG